MVHLNLRLDTRGAGGITMVYKNLISTPVRISRFMRNAIARSVALIAPRC